VLTSFQQVENVLAPLRILAAESGITDPAVIISQTNLLQNQRTAINRPKRRMVASVSLVHAHGDRWDITLLPTSRDLRR
jgi:hypothetical protein